MELYVATTNPGKLRDFAQSLTPGFTLQALPHLDRFPAPEETADTFEGNARIKAEFYSRAVPGLFILADDSGLEVDAINGAPGVRSARFAADASYTLEPQASNGDPEEITQDQLNNLLLVDMLLQRPFATRTARYRAVLALARDGVVLATASGTVEGEVIIYPRGQGGFGYDPYFLIPQEGHTMAELAPEVRQRYSHRTRALSQLLLTLPNHLLETER